MPFPKGIVKQNLHCKLTFLNNAFSKRRNVAYFMKRKHGLVKFSVFIFIFHNIIQYKDFKNTVHKLFEINLLQVLCLQNVQPEEYKKN